MESKKRFFNPEVLLWKDYYSFLLKNWIFPLAQRIQGRDFHKMMEYAQRNQFLSRDEMRDLQFEKLTSLLHHAYQNVPYYHSSFSEAGIIPSDIKTWDDIQKIPILTKEQIRDNKRLFLAKELWSPVYKVRTTGSTGIPLSFYKSQNAALSSHICRIRALRWWGIELGDRNFRINNLGLYFGNGFKRFYNERIKTPIWNRAMNRKSMPAYYMTPERMEYSWRALKKFSPKYLFGYPSAIAIFARYLDDHGYDGREADLKLAVTTGELLHRWQEQAISEVFGCPVADIYGTVEVGVIAIGHPCGKMHTMDDIKFIEVQKQNQENEHGQVIVTHLEEWSCPIIRYKLGDIARPVRETISCTLDLGFSIIEGLEGRSQDVIRLPSGRILIGNTFHRLMYVVGGVRQFQVIQKMPDLFEFTIVPDGRLFTRQQEDILHSIADKHLEGANIIINQVESIPRESTGKIRYVKSEVGI